MKTKLNPMQKLEGWTMGKKGKWPSSKGMCGDKGAGMGLTAIRLAV